MTAWEAVLGAFLQVWTFVAYRRRFVGFLENMFGGTKVTEIGMVYGTLTTVEWEMRCARTQR